MQTLASAFRSAGLEPTLCSDAVGESLALVEGISTLPSLQILKQALEDCPLRGSWVIFAQLCEPNVLVGIYADLPRQPYAEDLWLLETKIKNLAFGQAPQEHKHAVAALRTFGENAEVTVRLGDGKRRFRVHAVERGYWTALRQLDGIELSQLGLGE